MSAVASRPTAVRVAPPLRVVGLVVGGAGLTIAAPLAYAAWLDEPLLPYALPLALSAALFAVAYLAGRRVDAPNRREALAAAVLTWVGLSALGILPYVLRQLAGGR